MILFSDDINLSLEIKSFFEYPLSLFINLKMTYFPNFGLLNNMSQHLANNGAPKILDYDINNETGYTYVPASTDLVRQSLPTNDPITKQQRFNSAINDLIFSSRNSGGTSTTQPSTSDLSIRHESVINSLMNQGNKNTNISQSSSLNTTSGVSSINDRSDDDNSKKEQFIVKPDEQPSIDVEKQNKINFISVIIILFIVFMLIQLYLSQKKMEFLMDIATRQSISMYRGNDPSNNRKADNLIF